MGASLQPKGVICMSEITAREFALQEKVPPRAWAVLFTVWFASVYAAYCQFKIPPLASWLFPAFRGELDAVVFGTLMSAIAIIGVILAFPAAFIVRKIGLRNVIVLSMACLAAGSVVGGLATSVEVLLAGRLLEGVGIGFVGVAAPSCVTVWFPIKKRGMALGFWTTWVPIGSVLAFNTVPMMAGAFGYQFPFFFTAAICVVALVLFAIAYKMPPGASGVMAVDGTFKDGCRLLKNRRIWILGIVFFLFCACTIGIMNTYYNTFLETQLGFDAQMASSLTSIIMLISMFVAPLTGKLMDKLPLGRKFIVSIIMMVLLIPTGFFMFDTGSGAYAIMWAVIILQGVGGGMCGGSLRPTGPMVMPKTAMGATMAMAVLQFCQNMGSAIGSPLFGAVMSTFGWQTASLALQLPSYVLALVLCFFILPRGKDAKLEYEV